jgi:hypothetical protein
MLRQPISSITTTALALRFFAMLPAITQTSIVTGMPSPNFQGTLIA